jgi:hypothetical protein
MRIAVLTLAFLACSKQGPRDVGNQKQGSVFADAPRTQFPADDGGVVHAPPAARPREIARAETRAIATNKTHVFFGDTADDALYSLKKGETTPKRIARRAPMPGTLSVDGDAVVWIASPGDVVFRVPAGGGSVFTVRDRSIFTDAVASQGDVFFTEAQGHEGLLSRVTGTTAAKLVGFDGTPRGIAVDDDEVFIATSTELVTTPRTRGTVKKLASGSFTSPRLDAAWVYAVLGNAKSRQVVRIKKTGGPVETIAKNVRDAPIAVRAGVAYWFDADRPVLLASSGQAISEDPSFERIGAIEVDDDGAFIASGSGESARIVQVTLR